MDVSVETLQAFLDDAWDADPASADTLRDTLRGYEKQATALFRGGSIQSVSKNSASQSYRGPGLGSYTPVQIANAWRTLINLFDVALKDIDDAGDADSDTAVYAEMKTRLRVCTEYSSDVTNLRLAPTLAPTGVTW